MPYVNYNQALNEQQFTQSNPAEFISGLMESFNIPINESGIIPVNLYRENMIYREGTYIKDCSFFVTQELCEECLYDSYLIENATLLEGAKLDMALKNFLKEGKDYRGLKKEVEYLIDAYDLDERKMQSGRNGIMHAIKRVLQILIDMSAFVTGIGIGGYTIVAAPIAGGTAAAAASAAGASTLGVAAAAATAVTVAVVIAIISYIVILLINRVWRYVVDSVEYETIEKDGQMVIRQLRKIRDKSEDDKLTKKCKESIDKLEKQMEHYKKKSLKRKLDEMKYKKKHKKNKKSEDE